MSTARKKPGLAESIVLSVLEILSLVIIGVLGALAVSAWRQGIEWLAIASGAATILQTVRLVRTNGAS